MGTRLGPRIGALCVCTSVAVGVAGLSAGRGAGAQTIFDDRSLYDATQCMAVTEEQMIENKKKFRAVFAENKCSRPVHALACFEVTRPSFRFPREGWYCDFRDYKSRSRTMVSDRARYARVKKSAACNPGNEDCIERLRYTEGVVNESGRDPEDVAGRRN